MNPPIHQCPDCGLFSRLHDPVSGTDQRCGRCNRILRRVRRNSLNLPLVSSLTGLIFFIVVMTSPLLTVNLYGRPLSGDLSTGPIQLDNQGLWPVAAVVFLVTIFVPIVKLLCAAYVLIGIRMKRPPPGLITVFAWLHRIGPWSMVDVYMLGFLVAYTRLQTLMYVHLGGGLYALAGFMVASVTTDAGLDPEAVWEIMQARGIVKFHSRPPQRGEILIGCETCHQVSHARDDEDCPRCGEDLHIRKPGSFTRAWALLVTAAILYIPSNILPIMTVVRFGKLQSYTIFAGMMELVKVGLWPLAVLVFVASIVIPCFKLVALAYNLVQTQRGARRDLRGRAKLYRVIDFIGRWSMVDVFMVSILVALVRFGFLAQITADAGALYFCAVVILTILAVEFFDPRLMWDAAVPTAPDVYGQKEAVSS